MDNLYLLAFGTFGHPNDFRQTVFGEDKSGIAKHIKTFDLNINAIKIFPNGKLYALRKENIAGVNLISYSIYTHAKEQNSEREGTFIGSSFIFVNEVPEESFILSKLNEFHDGLIYNNLQNNVLKVKHSKDFTVPKISDIDKFSFNSKKIDSLSEFNANHSNLLLLTRLEISALQKKLKIGSELLNIYDTIFFTDNKEIAESARNKNIYKTVDDQGFDQEIQNLIEARKQKIRNKILELEKEKISLEEKRRKVYSDFEIKIKRNEETQVENKKKIDESKINLNNQNSIFQQHIKNLEELIISLKNNEKSGEVNQIYIDYKNNFEQDLRKIKDHSFIQTVPNSRINSNIPQENWNNSDHRNQRRNYDEQENDKLSLGTIISLALNFLLIIGAVVFFTMFYDKKEDYRIQNPLDNQINSTEQIPDSDSLQFTLSPYPNDVAKDEVNRTKMLKKLNDCISLEKVVDVIFEKNKVIKDDYVSQKEEYGKYLQNQNPNAFGNSRDGIILIKKDSLLKIPVFKSQK